MQELDGKQNPAVKITRHQEYVRRHHLKSIFYQGKSIWAILHGKAYKAAMSKPTTTKQAMKRLEYYTQHWQLFDQVITSNKIIMNDMIGQLRKEVQPFQ